MNVLRLIGGQGAGKSQTLARIKSTGWFTPSGIKLELMSLKVRQGHLDDLGNMIDRTGIHPQALLLDIEAELTPKAQQRVIQQCEARGVQQLFLAYNE